MVIIQVLREIVGVSIFVIDKIVNFIIGIF